MVVTPYPVELFIYRTREESVRGSRYDVTLHDRETPDAGRGAGSAFLDFEKQHVEGLGGTVSDFLKVFLRGDGGTFEDGLLFGRHLLERLLSDGEVREVWKAIQGRRGARPLRLELILPDEDVEGLAGVPFEMLADRDGFLFRRPGAVLVRVIQRLAPQPHMLEQGDSVLVAWANPVVDDESRLPADLFERHEQRTAAAATLAGFRPRPSCNAATRKALETRMAEGRGTPIISLIAHGDSRGGAAWLHKEDHPQYPDDPGDVVTADDLAGIFRAGKARVALLWTCYGARRAPLGGSIASALLHPEKGGLSAVVTSHAALRAEGTDTIAEKVFESLREERNLERAVARARSERPETDLQWAAPVYYARPQEGRTVEVAEVVSALSQAPASAPGNVERAPSPWPHLRGRDDKIVQGLSDLRAGRLLSVTGMPGMGKTEVALAIARAAACDATFDIDRAIWFAGDGHGSADAVRALIAVAFSVKAGECNDDEALARQIGRAAVLLVLDNAEDPIRRDSGGMRNLVNALLQACPNARILLTSRMKLGHVRAADENELPVKNLAEEAAREVFLSVAGERLTDEDRSATELTKILEWLDGHPFSIVLVARQTDGMSLVGILRRLETRGAEAVQSDELFGEDPAPDQDEKLRKDRLVSSLNLSYRPMVEKTPGAAEMFAWLGHFSAGLPGVLVSIVFGEDGEEHRAALLRRGMAEEVGLDKRLLLPSPVRAYAKSQQRHIIEYSQVQRLLLASWGALRKWLVKVYSSHKGQTPPHVMDAALLDQVNIESLLVANASMGGSSTEFLTTLSKESDATRRVFAQLLQLTGVHYAAAGLQVEATHFFQQAQTHFPETGELPGTLYVRPIRFEEDEEAPNGADQANKPLDQDNDHMHLE